MLFINYIFAAAAGYCLGCLNASIFISRCFCRRDVREGGSGNAGATNMTRQFGPCFGALALFGDMLKAFLAAYMGKRLGGEYGMTLACCCCIIGHCFPAIHHLHGGKGVSVALAAGILTDWRGALVGLAVFIIVMALSKRVSLSSLCGALTFPVCAIAMHCSHCVCFTAVFIFITIAFQHRGNIRRLIAGTEPKLELKHRE